MTNFATDLAKIDENLAKFENVHRWRSHKVATPATQIYRMSDWYWIPLHRFKSDQIEF